MISMIAFTKIFNVRSLEETAVINMVSFIIWTTSILIDNSVLGWIGFSLASGTLIFNIIGLAFINKAYFDEERTQVVGRYINQTIFSICFTVAFLALRNIQ